MDFTQDDADAFNRHKTKLHNTLRAQILRSYPWMSDNEADVELAKQLAQTAQQTAACLELTSEGALDGLTLVESMTAINRRAFGDIADTIRVHQNARDAWELGQLQNPFHLPLNQASFAFKDIEKAAKHNGYIGRRRALYGHLAKWAGKTTNERSAWQLERTETEGFLTYLFGLNRGK